MSYTPGNEYLQLQILHLEEMNRRLLGILMTHGSYQQNRELGDLWAEYAKIGKELEAEHAK